ncbi:MULTISPECIES: hypothetical protein [unclassified Streptomyces]|uniref:hypothetical protein n=1 Tax=unclassified Streptomyces TaxID=2593676 RepID=UPI0036ED9D9E
MREIDGGQGRRLRIIRHADDQRLRAVVVSGAGRRPAPQCWPLDRVLVVLSGDPDIGEPLSGTTADPQLREYTDVDHVCVLYFVTTPRTVVVVELRLGRDGFQPLGRRVGEHIPRGHRKDEGTSGDDRPLLGKADQVLRA